MSPARRRSAPISTPQPTPRGEFDREMLEAARMLGQLMAEALLSCYRSLKARQAMEDAERRVQQEVLDRSAPSPGGRSGVEETGVREGSGTRIPALLTINEAAGILGISRTGLYQLVARGEVPVLRMGKSVRIVPSQLEEWIRERSTRPCRISCGGA